MPQTSIRSDEREIISEVHQLRGEPGVRKVLELLANYRAKETKMLLASEGKRGKYIGAIRIIDRVIKNIIEGPRSLDKT